MEVCNVVCTEMLATMVHASFFMCGAKFPQSQCIGNVIYIPPQWDLFFKMVHLESKAETRAGIMWLTKGPFTKQIIRPQTIMGPCPKAHSNPRNCTWDIIIISSIYKFLMILP